MTALDEAYTERAHLVALLATLYPAYKTPALDVDEPGWWLLFMYASEQQMSWHFSPADAHLITGVQTLPSTDWRVEWDGHTTEQKYARIRQMLVLIA